MDFFGIKCLNAAHRTRPDFVSNLIMLDEFMRHPDISGYVTQKGRNVFSATEVLRRSFCRKFLDRVFALIDSSPWAKYNYPKNALK